MSIASVALNGEPVYTRRHKKRNYQWTERRYQWLNCLWDDDDEFDLDGDLEENEKDKEKEKKKKDAKHLPIRNKKFPVVSLWSTNNTWLSSMFTEPPSKSCFAITTPPNNNITHKTSSFILIFWVKTGNWKIDNLLTMLTAIKLKPAINYVPIVTTIWVGMVIASFQYPGEEQENVIPLDQSIVVLFQIFGIFLSSSCL